MEQKKFKLIDNLLGILVFAISAITYLSTIEPTTSFWDCGEFIASSYKLEIGHAPGNPVFQLIARFFTLFTDNTHAAMMINAMSALCSALTIMFLFWTITHLARRISGKTEATMSLSTAITVLGAGVVGSLAYTFSDTFWFSAVEGEVYAMSSLFTAAVFWAMLKWEENADKPYANKWIVLIALLMGLSIGVHLLNLLTIPALVFIYYYKKYNVTKKGIFWVLVLSAVILAVILYGIIPYLPKIASWFDLLFVNVFGLGINSGAAFFLLLLILGSLFAVWYTHKKGKVLANTILLCFSMIVIGYSTYAVVIIRSSANTPTNENQPDNAFSLVRYLGREQYGSNPLIYGETYASPYDVKQENYYAKIGDKYVKVIGPVQPVYDAASKILFPRMWSSSSSDHVKFYKMYTEGRGKAIAGSDEKIPLMSDNLSFFFDYQLNWMYLRYFMWNFAGRQNDLHGSTPGDAFRGNWESGIGFLDKARLGDQSEGPAYIVESKAKNHYYMLPLFLGILGLFYQLAKDRKNTWIVALLFILTGVAIVVYLNQPPYQPRERDYAYAGSFYAFAIWIGLGVPALYDAFKKRVPGIITASFVTLAALSVPVLMAAENWDDHDRSGRYSARDLAYNYLNSCDKQAILVTHGDNDTFPLWYIQEVEGVRTDVRIMNTSLLGTDWYIDQMKYKTYESEPVKLSIPKKDYLYGTNDMIHVVDKINRPVPIKAVIDFISNPDAKIQADNGKRFNFIASRQLLIPVNVKNALACGIVSEADSAQIQNVIQLNIPEGKNALTKCEMMILDMLANYEWDRPIYFVSMGGDLELGLRDYLEYDGFAYKFVPIKSSTSLGSPGRVLPDVMYDKCMNVYKWGKLNDPKVNVDYQNLLTFNALMSGRSIYTTTARSLMENGKAKEAVEVLDKMQEYFIPSQFPLNCSLMPSLNEISVMEAIEIYLQAGEREKGVALINGFIDETYKALDLFSKKYKGMYLSKYDIEQNLTYILHLADILKNCGEEQLSADMEKKIEQYLNTLQG
ncbi:MAG: DUF2723 domain-containing protein [Rikenellaceae bacterium]|nr:DUF2723 domain-containing protein [Rikenellaceae bacterium]